MSVTHLDYQPAKLTMECNTPIEQGYRVRACTKEPWTTEFIEQCPEGAIFWDIGANVGPYTLVGAHRGLNVVAIEPHFGNYATLCRNLGLNSLLDRVVTLCCALGPANGWAWMHLQDARSGAGGHVVSSSARKIYLHKMLVQVRTWDTLLANLPWQAAAPHYAKLDTEGGELPILQGAPQMLAQLQGLLVEATLGQEEAIVKLLEGAGLKRTARYDQRDGKPIHGVAYSRFERQQ